MDLSLKEAMQFVVQGGVAIVVFIIWYFTFTNANKRQEEKAKLDKEAQDQTNKTLAEAFDRLHNANGQLIQLLKDEQEYKLQLAGILDRLSLKLETPAQCPILMAGKKIKLEVTE
ncbi:MAG: hypothetical protein AB1805_07555 [Nitrospirota bacterium]